MAVRANIMGGAAVGFTEKKQDNEQRLKDGVKKLREAFELDARADATRGSGLPKDWRSRILK